PPQPSTAPRPSSVGPAPSGLLLSGLLPSGLALSRPALSRVQLPSAAATSRSRPARRRRPRSAPARTAPVVRWIDLALPGQGAPSAAAARELGSRQEWARLPGQPRPARVALPSAAP